VGFKRAGGKGKGKGAVGFMGRVLGVETPGEKERKKRD